ncbi:MAG: branched-chain amino acid ABC transporter permease [Alphaproteobacteria bacterium]|jgi:branched-chain amino acid transport system permease protein|nr:branched-chain amino acid ABC transporter permease [Alphaproteobacteria bacterium]MBT4020058.1 branched-chain amino acid ABC transporter permease [Alphaproteobacteria bacterium]MBT5161900.1 branched-chain amino acid ABC transporter permease [Alphaproteobacteria bacterium]MBT7744116.1 branched-chain amino acid ABC transporter permease [Alphaproteobacteria bacterium]
MSVSQKTFLLYAFILLGGILAPFVFPNYIAQFATLWLMILFALTWDMMGGQMGYNSLGNIIFFGVGMYASAVVQIARLYEVAEYTSHSGAPKVDFGWTEYLSGMGFGIIAGALAAIFIAVILGRIVFGLRGPYFAIGTLGAAIAAGELVGAWDYIGGGGGITSLPFPGTGDERSLFFYFALFALALLTFAFLKWLYSRRYVLAVNAIRDDEDKAEAMGIHTLRYKTVTWAMSASFLGMAGAVYGNMAGFIEPLEVAFPTITFGIFMVLMALLGGKGTLWGPVLGAVVFHIIKEFTWTHFLGWQWVALGMLIIINVAYFQQGILGWAQEKWPDFFGLTVDESDTREAVEEASK